MDVCLQNSGTVHPFIVEVDYEVGEMLAIKEKIYSYFPTSIP